MIRHAFGQDHLDQHHGAVRGHRLPDVPQDRQRAVLVPVVDDRFQQVGVGTFGDRVEERTTGDGDAVGNARGIQYRAGTRDHRRQVEEHTACRGRLLQYRGQQLAMPATDVGDGAELAEIVSGQKGFDHHVRQPGHGVVEYLGQLGFALDVIEGRHTAEHLQRGLTGLHRIQQMSPVLPVLRVADELQHGRHGPGRVGPQGLAEAGQREPPAALLLEQ
ncbi:Uncharacterised protein [Mycobacteroides abscessus subsp. abscessus]|nr:Uncharacterised protein [Mycobacteroides abscessus subsp. abscessus]